MHNSILLETLEALNELELEELEKFLCSPFFNRSKKSQLIISLYRYIKPYHPEMNNFNLKKETVYQHLFGEEAIIKNKLEKLMSDLLILIKEFIVHQRSTVSINEQKKLYYLGQFYKEKKLTKRFETVSKNLCKQKNKGTTINSYFQQFQNHQLIAEFSSLQNKRKGDALNIPQTLDSLDVYYILNKLQIATITVLQSNFSSKLNFEKIQFLPEILKAIREGLHKDVPLIQLYFHVFYMLQEPYSDKDYKAFKKNLSKCSNNLAKPILRQFQTCAINFCVLKHNAGDIQYTKEVFELYKTYLPTGTLYYNGKLRPSTIKNIVHFGLLKKEYQWVKSFLEKHENKITQTKYPHEIYNFNLSVYYFHKKEFNKALDILVNKYEDVYYKIASRRLRLKLLYETQSPILESRIDAFKVLLFRISRQVLSEDQKMMNNNFIDLLRQILHPKTFKNPDRIKKLKSKIQSKEKLTEKVWLLEKLDELN